MRTPTKEVFCQMAVITQQFKVISLGLFYKMIQSISCIKASVVSFNSPIMVFMVESEPAIIRDATTNTLPAIAIEQFYSHSLTFFSRPLNFVCRSFFGSLGWLARASVILSTPILSLYFVLMLSYLLLVFGWHQSNLSLFVLILLSTEFLLMKSKFFGSHNFGVSYSRHTASLRMVSSTSRIISYMWCDKECGRQAEQYRATLMSPEAVSWLAKRSA